MQRASSCCELPGMHSVPKSAVLPYASGVGGLSRRLLNIYIYVVKPIVCLRRLGFRCRKWCRAGAASGAKHVWPGLLTAGICFMSARSVLVSSASLTHHQSTQPPKTLNYPAGAVLAPGAWGERTAAARHSPSEPEPDRMRCGEIMLWRVLRVFMHR